MFASGQEPSGNLAHIATITSRAEALVIASALEHAGIAVWVDGAAHASADPLSVALCGHRLRVFAGQWAEASDVIREMGLTDADVSYRGGQTAIGKFLFFWIGGHIFFAVPAIIAGFVSPLWLVMMALSQFVIPVDPRGTNEYHLIAEA